jgi:membrane-bound serine protease (ClpP class)
MEEGPLQFFQHSECYQSVFWGIVFTIALLIAFSAIFVVRKAMDVHRRKPVSGREGMLGEKGTADSDIHAMEEF